jgi:hypothetical protein
METAAIRPTNRIQIGSGKRCPVVKILQKALLNVTSRVRPDVHGWFAPDAYEDAGSLWLSANKSPFRDTLFYRFSLLPP